MSEIENKKWLIERIEYNLQKDLRALQTEKEQLAVFTHRYLSAFRTFRNTSLSVLGFIATLIPSLASIGLLKSPVIEILLIIVLIIAVIIFVVISLHTFKVNRSLNGIELAYLMAEGIVNQARSFLGFHALHLDFVSIEQLYTLSDYNDIVSGLARLWLFHAYSKAATSVLFDANKRDLCLAATNQKSTLDMTVQEYEWNKEKFQKEKQFLSTLSPLVENCLTQYKNSKLSPNNEKLAANKTSEDQSSNI